MKRVYVDEISKDELLEAISKMLDEKLPKLASLPPVEMDTFITRQQVAEMFGITLPTVHKWINEGILTPYKIGHKTRFILKEVKAAPVKSNKINKNQGFDID